VALRWSRRYAPSSGEHRPKDEGHAPLSERAFLKNHVEIELCAHLFLLSIEEKIKSLREDRPNDPEKISQRGQTIADLEDLKCRVEAFLSATSQFAAKKAKEASVVETTTSFAAGIQDWWAKDHVQICRQSALMTLFGIGVATCSLAGAGGAWAVGISGALVGGKPVVDAIKAVAKQSHARPKDHQEFTQHTRNRAKADAK
jgi:hypothetical protein